MPLDSNYPQYPEPVSNLNRPHLSQNDHLENFRLLRRVGFYVLPKRTTAKVPHWDFWTKKNTKYLHSEEMAMEYQSRTDVEGWCVVTGVMSNNLIVIDLDPSAMEAGGLDPATIYYMFQEICPTSFVLGTPSNGVHMYYLTPDELPLLNNINPPFAGVDIRGEGGQVVSLGGINQYTGRSATKKGVVDGHVAAYVTLPFGSYSKPGTMNLELYKRLTAQPKKFQAGLSKTEIERQTEQGRKNLAKYDRTSQSKKVVFTKEMLSYVLKDWDDHKEYDDWIRMWMSAHHAAEGDKNIMNYIIEHPKVVFSDGREGINAFRDKWGNHRQRPIGELDGDGNIIPVATVATLRTLAREAGWLSTTGYEITDFMLTDQIDETYISDWVKTLDEFPDLLLLMSQTGSGKTFALKTIWNRLGQPKTVILVPSIKLATSLHRELVNIHKLPAVLYRDLENGLILDREELIKAPILVSTLQTFAQRVWDNNMEQYGLVYVEESDQLIRDFARGGGGMHTSHVSPTQTRIGWACLRAAIEQAGHVYFVDATMSRVTYDLVALYNHDRTLQVVRNTRITPKAPVRFLSKEEDAFYQIMSALIQGKKVVVICDTAAKAMEVRETMKKLGLLGSRGKLSIVITGDTGSQPEVKVFMDDVNVGAAKYDLVCYNSVMGSGVSITDIEADVVVQIATFLPPSNNLQLLNRYRKQGLVYCYYRWGEELDKGSAEEVRTEAEARADREAELVSMKRRTRNDDAKARDAVASVAIGDVNQQERSARTYYMNLLKADGREVTTQLAGGIEDRLQRAVQGTRAARKKMLAHVAKTWRETPPIDQERPAFEDYTPLQIAQGLMHAKIEKYLMGNIPLPEVATDEEVYDIVTQFERSIYPLTAYLQQDTALLEAEHWMADRTKALITLSNDITLVAVVGLTRYLFTDLYETLPAITLTERASKFLDELEKVSADYDRVIFRPEQKYEAIPNRQRKGELVNDTPEKLAVAYSKVLLGRIGLAQRTKRAGDGGKDKTYYIANLKEAETFCSWRLEDEFQLDQIVAYEDLVDRASREAFKSLSKETQDEVLDFMAQEKCDLGTALNIVQVEEDVW
ncbi:hypothetical protein LCGC14_0990380 [marine sediment metagenome]|uniref:DNA primase/polymerase bifunctional N-terminal domain-containing protein n=1 Tax=marine sediment metagenome TaxID=412755 RepID=A0A0F9N5W8_9ZZZZ